MLTDLVFMLPLDMARQALFAAVATTISLREIPDLAGIQTLLSTYLGTRLGFIRHQPSSPEITFCLTSAALVTLVTRPTVRLWPVLVNSITVI